MFERLFGSKSEPTTTDVSVAEARNLQQHGAQLIDVRESSEFAAGHARGARNIPLSQLANRMGELHTDGTVLLICQSGSRSRTAQTLLERQNVRNVRNVRNVKGGTSAWRAARLPME
jgi:rhodanese-related sulfurtransferase